MNIFGKLLLSFIAAYLLSLVVTVFVAFPLWHNLQPTRQVTDLGGQALSIYQSGGDSALSAWLHELRKRTHTYGLLVDMKGNRLPTDAPRMPRPFRHNLQRLIDGEDRIALPHGGKLMAITLSDEAGNAWRWVALLPPERGSRLPPLLLRLGIGIVVLAIAAWLVSLLLTRPISALRQTSQALARGELDSRTPASLVARKDELGTLASDFNRMAERLQALLENHRRLLRDVSHELRSPLARLQIALELARERRDPQLLDRIELEANRLEHMLDEVLTLSRLSETGLCTAGQQFSLSDLVLTVVSDARFEASRRGTKINARIDTCVVDGDQGLLRRAVDNVLRNAVQHSPNQAKVDVTLSRTDGNVVLEVADCGPGAPEAELEKLFLPFHRTSEARDRESGGYGLGLAIAASAVARHGGQILARNREGGGLVVTIKLPVPAN